MRDGTKRAGETRWQRFAALGLSGALACGSDPASNADGDAGALGAADASLDAGARDASGTDATAQDAGDAGPRSDAEPPADAAPPPAPIWVAAWADAPDSEGGSAGSSATFRAIVKPTVGSRGKVRLHFSNFFGAAPVALGAVHVGVQTTGAGVRDDVEVTFGGNAAVTLPANGFVTSDEIALSFAYGDVLAITEYVSGSWTKLTQHNQGGGVVTSYATASNAGDKTGDLAGTSFTQHVFPTFLLDRVEVLGDYAGTIATFGSSTTDGIASGVDAHMTYPEQLAAALHDAGRDDLAVANVGIAGTTVLGSGPTAGIHRFARDVVALPNVKAVIDYLGANDLRIDCVTASALIDGKKDLVAQARAAGLTIYVATTAPSTFCGAQRPGAFGTRFGEGTGEEAQRFLVLDWERAAAKPDADGGPALVDGLVDFDGAIVDPSNKSYMLPALDSGDDVHPNATGYGRMVKAIPLSLF